MESHLVRIINRLELMTTDGSNLKRNFERDGVVVAEVSFSNDPENGPVFTLRDVEAREDKEKIQTQYKGKGFLVLSILFLSVVSVLSYIAILN